MFISGLALTFDPGCADALISTLEIMPGVEVVGLDVLRGRAALVVESDHLRSEVGLAEQVAALPEVLEVQMVYHAFDEGPRPATPLSDIADRLS